MQKIPLIVIHRTLGKIAAHLALILSFQISAAPHYFQFLPQLNGAEDMVLTVLSRDSACLINILKPPIREKSCFFALKLVKQQHKLLHSNKAYENKRSTLINNVQY